jgi:hypothetical protein
MEPAGVQFGLLRGAVRPGPDPTSSRPKSPESLSRTAAPGHQLPTQGHDTSSRPRVMTPAPDPIKEPGIIEPNCGPWTYLGA